MQNNIEKRKHAKSDASSYCVMVSDPYRVTIHHIVVQLFFHSFMHFRHLVVAMVDHRLQSSKLASDLMLYKPGPTFIRVFCRIVK